MEERVFGRRYRAVERIGAGGMADVFKGTDSVLGRTVAVKVLHQRLASDPTFAARFRQEAQSAANLQSSNIVQIYDWGQEGDTYFIVMEYVNGTDLKSIIERRGALAPKQVADIGAQVCSALTAAHAAQVIHRDIKPHNIMVQPDGLVKVMDFGIARAGNTTMTQTGSVLGTAHYVSPEQAQGRALTPASDLYSLGVVLYEAATGKLPFDADTPVAVALKQVNEVAPPPRSLNPAIPASLEAIITKAMAKDPHDRYSSAEEMRKDLLAVAQGQPVNVVAPPPPDRTQVLPQVDTAPPTRSSRAARPAKKRRVWPWVLLAALLAVAGVALAWQMGVFGPATEPVPDIVGMTGQQAERTIIEAGFTVGSVRREFSAEVAAGRVISQSPVGGEQAQPGSPIDFVVSGGVEQATVPDVVGKDLAEARAILAEAGFELDPIAREEYSDKPEDSIIAQSPKAGETAAKGSAVTVTVSKGKRLITVPNVIKKSRDQATQILEGAKLKVAYKEVFDDTVKRGIVIDQNPVSGSPAYEGSTVTITVSKGPQLFSVPDVVGDSEDSARSRLEAAGFRVVVTTREDPSDGVVLEQDPKAGTQREAGTTVTIVVGVAPPDQQPPPGQQ